MKGRDAFSGYHPVVNLVYFVLVLGFSMFLRHPVCLGLSLVCALIYAAVLRGKGAADFGFKFVLPLAIIAALVNPAFNHEGVTILGYLYGGNPLTLESIFCGLGTALMLMAVVEWFYCLNAVLTTDKLVYLFGRIMPSLSLLLSMTLRFVPRFSAQFKEISAARHSIGRGTGDGGIVRRAKNTVEIVSIMITGAFEGSLETADSMVSRGYGLEGRTAFSIYSMERRDGVALAFMVAAAVYAIAGAIKGAFYWRWFPTLRGAEAGAYSVSVFVCYAALCAVPIYLERRERKKWKAIMSKR